jgi:hypothetical protein
MSKNHKTIVALTFLLFASFPVMILGGIYLTYESAVIHNPADPHVISATDNKNMAMDFVMAIPGIVLIVLGYLGAFIMLLKVPAKEIIDYGNAQAVDKENGLLPSPVLSEKITKISLPVWWLIKSKGVYSKIQENI